MQAFLCASMSRAPISVIIPSYQAMPRLTECLSALVEGLGAGLIREAIVVDAGSSDHSAALATDMGCRVIQIDETMRGRGFQLQQGAQAAAGDWLLFLHADTVLQVGWLQAVEAHIFGPDAAKAAYFQLAFNQTHKGARRVASLANLRAAILGLPYGDAGLLLPRKLYEAVGGYQNLALMEDVDLIRRIGKSRLVGLSAIAQTSGQKFERGGWVAVPLRNLVLASAFLLGMKPATLARLYR
jgi:rSAM/selenodomain-associated transferase 2